MDLRKGSTIMSIQSGVNNLITSASRISAIARTHKINLKVRRERALERTRDTVKAKDEQKKEIDRHIDSLRTSLGVSIGELDPKLREKIKSQLGGNNG